MAVSVAVSLPAASKWPSPVNTKQCSTYIGVLFNFSHKGCHCTSHTHNCRCLNVKGKQCDGYELSGATLGPQFTFTVAVCTSDCAQISRVSMHNTCCYVHVHVFVCMVWNCIVVLTTCTYMYIHVHVYVCIYMYVHVLSLSTLSLFLG